MSPKTQTEAQTETPVVIVPKPNLTATIVGAVVSVGLGVVAQVLIGRTSDKVVDKITAKKNKTEDE